jgi:hypothetical protein
VLSCLVFASSAVFVHYSIFPSLSWQQLHTFNCNLTYGYTIEKCRSGSNLVMVWWFLQSYAPLRNFQFTLITAVVQSQQRLAYGCVREISKFKFVHGSMICYPYEWWPSNFKKKKEEMLPFIISPTGNSCTHPTQIWHMDTPKECTGHLNLVMVWWFLTEICQLNFEKKKKIQFLSITSPTVVHF